MVSCHSFISVVGEFPALLLSPLKQGETVAARERLGPISSPFQFAVCKCRFYGINNIRKNLSRIMYQC